MAEAGNDVIKAKVNEIGHEGFVKGIRLIDAVTIVVGTMIGSGIFIVSADMARNLGSPALLLIVWLFSGVMTLAAALSYAELAAAMPHAGGQYVFLREAYGRLPAFLFGWTFFLVIATGINAAVAVAFAKFAGVIFPVISATNIIFQVGPVVFSTQRFVAMIVVGVLTYVNCRGVREGAFVQNLFTFLKTFAVVLLAIAGLSIGKNPEVVTQNFTHMFAGSPTGFTLIAAIGAAMVGGLFAMDSWANVCFTAAETKNPEKNLPRALLYGTGFVLILYLLVNIAYMYVLPFLGSADGADIMSQGIQFAKEDRVATAAAKAMLGNVGLYLIAGAIMISTFGCVNGGVMTGARVFYAMAKDRLFFKPISKINPKTHVPTTSLIVSGIWTCLLTLTGSYSDLLDYVIFATLIFYALTVGGVMILRKKRPDLKRPYHAWGYPYLQWFYIVSAALVALTLLIYKPVYTWPGLIIVLSGVPVYYIWQVRRRRSERV